MSYKEGKRTSIFGIIICLPYYNKFLQVLGCVLRAVYLCWPQHHIYTASRHGVAVLPTHQHNTRYCIPGKRRSIVKEEEEKGNAPPKHGYMASVTDCMYAMVW